MGNSIMSLKLQSMGLFVYLFHLYSYPYNTKLWTVPNQEVKLHFNFNNYDYKQQEQ